MAFLRNKAFAALPVVMGEAAKINVGLDAEATVGTSSPDADGCPPLPMPPDASSSSQQTVVTLDGCNQAYERFKAQYGVIPWSVLGNEALKALRELNEKEGVAQTKRVDLFNYDIMYIPKMHHAESGPEYWIDEFDQVPWSWKAMIARMSDKTKKPFAENCTVDFWFGWKDEVDHLRLGTFGKNKYATRPKVWDFYIKRKDGKTWLFHPAHSTSTVRMDEVSDLPSTPPPTGFEKTQDRLNRLYPFKECAQRTPSEQARVDQ